jgi:hypothetical protein
MTRVGAKPGTTKVIDSQAIGDGANKQLIRESVNVVGLVVDTEPAIAPIVRASAPQPTVIVPADFNLGPKAAQLPIM